jgi:hypothetical protein
VQNAKARAAEAAFRMGSASSYQRSAELAREAARVASLRAALAAHEPARRVCCMHEAQMHGMSANAWLRYGDVPAALRAARLASTCAEASGDVAQCVEAKIVLGTAFMKLPDDAESHRDVNGLATEPVAEAIAIFREAAALCEREWATSSAGTPLEAPAPGRLRAAERPPRAPTLRVHFMALIRLGHWSSWSARSRCAGACSPIQVLRRTPRPTPCRRSAGEAPAAREHAVQLRCRPLGGRPARRGAIGFRGGAAARSIRG